MDQVVMREEGGRWNRAFVVAFGAAWSVCMGLVGLLAITVWPERFGLSRGAMVGLGLALVAGSCFLFAVTVADRVFPRADSRVTGGVQAALWVVIVAGVVGGVRWLL